MKNSRKSHYTDVVRTFKSNELTVCHLLMSFIYVSYLLSVPPRAHDKSKVAGTCPSVPYGSGAYADKPFTANLVFITTRQSRLDAL